MLNIRGNLVMKGAILTIFLLITGVFVAVGTGDKEKMEVYWDGDRIEVEVWDFANNEKCYQIRYYQPNTLPYPFDEFHIYNEEDSHKCDINAPKPYSVDNPTGFFVNPKFIGDNSLYNEDKPYKENLTSPGPNGWNGEWIVVLMKNGAVVDCTSHPSSSCCDDCLDCTECCTDPDMLANSCRIHCHIVIPEFSTIALPIASILGIMFILQNRRRKED